MATHEIPTSFVPTGVPGLDEVLQGGLERHRLYVVEGVPGSGKTTLALQFLIENARRGESVLYVTLSETQAELEGIARSHGWRLDDIEIVQRMPSEDSLDPDAQSTMFHPSEVELADTTQKILDDVERVKPSCVVFDSLSELRLLAGSGLRHRRQILALKQYFAARECTVVLLDDLTGTETDLQMRSIAHGVIQLEHLSPEYGSERRRLRVLKYRGVAFRGGYHDYVIRRGGLQVFPRLVAAEYRSTFAKRQLQSGIEDLDRLLGGGLDAGSSTLLAGSAGTGKSTLAARFAASHASRGERAAIFAFDESPQMLLSRSAALGIDLAGPVDHGLVTVRQVDPAELTPGELIQDIRDAVLNENLSLVVIDSLNGYLNAVPAERYATIQLHELLAFLGHRGVATILVGAHQGIIGSQMATPVETSYLADTIVLLRYFEAFGEVRQAIAVVKKRGSSHERTLREFTLGARGVRVGRALREFRGVLTGNPTYEGAAGPLMGEDEGP